MSCVHIICCNICSTRMRTHRAPRTLLSSNSRKACSTMSAARASQPGAMHSMETASRLCCGGGAPGLPDSASASSVRSSAATAASSSTGAGWSPSLPSPCPSCPSCSCSTAQPAHSTQHTHLEQACTEQPSSCRPCSRQTPWRAPPAAQPPRRPHTGLLVGRHHTATSQSAAAAPPRPPGS